MRFAPPAEFRNLDRRVWLLAAARCVNTAGFSIVMPYLAIYFKKHAGASASEVGNVYAISAVVGAIATLVGGELSDRVGRRRVMLAALGGRVLVLMAMGFAIRGGAGLLGVAPLVVVNAILRSLFDPAAQAQVSVLATAGMPDGADVEKQRAAAFGLQRVGINLGWAVGPATGGFLVGHSFASLFFFAAATTLVTAIAIAFINVRETETNAVSSARFGLRDLWDVPRPRAWLFFLAIVLVMSVLTTQLYMTMSLYSTTRLAIPESKFAHIYTVNGLMVVLLQGLAVRYIQRAGTTAALTIGPLAYTAGYALVGLATGLPSLALAVAVITIGELLTEPAEMVAAATLGDPARPGRAMGVFGLVNALGNSLGPFVGGHLYDLTEGHPLALWWTVASLGVLGAIGYARVERIDRIGRRVREGETSASASDDSATT